jgi:hypothetical protein
MTRDHRLVATHLRIGHVFLWIHINKLHDPVAVGSRRGREKARGWIKDFKSHKLAPPIQLDVRFKNYRPSGVLSYLSIVEHSDAHSIRFNRQGHHRGIEIPGIHYDLRTIPGTLV